MSDQILELLQFIYGEAAATDIKPRLAALIERYRSQTSPPQRQPQYDERDAILITYGDMVQENGRSPLTTLGDFLEETVADHIRGVHILPFYPYSSDDGFSVIDYKKVNPAWGSWQDVARIGESFRLMFDAVVNHISAKSDWFQAFLQEERPYLDYFTVVDPGIDLSAVFRPRTHPVLTPFATAGGLKHVWTTFSPDQIDLNFANPDVMLAVMDVLLFYVVKGAEFIRLDAIAYIWKELGTDCIHRPQAHALIKLMRAILDEAAPHVCLITETNVPHKENISYFGNGRDEAQMVYNFSLPPLTLHAFHAGSAKILSQWADSLTLPSDQVTFFNFLASHDGIGVQPARGLLPDTAVSQMARRVEALGGYVSYKTNSDGSQSAYELNCNYLDALGDPDNSNESTTTMAARFIAAQAIMLALKGVPGIYFHSLFGSRNWPEGVTLTGQRRAINRQKLEKPALITELADKNSLRHYIFQRYKKLLAIRQHEAAFHPQGRQKVMFFHQAIFSLKRWSIDGREALICLQNASNQTQRFKANLKGQYYDLLEGKYYQATSDQLELTMKPYAVLWLKATSP